MFYLTAFSYSFTHTHYFIKIVTILIGPKYLSSSKNHDRTLSGRPRTNDNTPRVLRKQWQGEFCRCSIDVVGGKQRDGRVDHLERFRHNAGPSPKAGKPMAQPAVDPLNGHRFILPDIMPPNRQERVVRRIIVCTVQLDAPGLQPLQQPVQRGGITTFPVDEAERSKASQIHSLFFFLKEMPELVQFHHALAR